MKCFNIDTAYCAKARFLLKAHWVLLSNGSKLRQNYLRSLQIYMENPKHLSYCTLGSLLKQVV